MLVLLASTVIFVLGLVRFQWAVIAFVFTLPFFPRVLALSIGEGGLALTQRRAGIIVLFVLFVLQLAVNKNWQRIITKLISTQRSFFIILLCLLFLKLLSTLVNSGLSPLLYVADEFLFSILIIFCVAVSIRTLVDERKLMLAMIIGLVLSGLLTVVEQVKGAPLLKDEVEIEVAIAKDGVLEGREREGSYRSQALFDNPLLLSEFTCLMLPFVFLGLNQFTQKPLLLSAALLLPYILWAVNSRSGFIASFIGAFVFLLVPLWFKLGFFAKKMLSLFILLLLSMISYYIFSLLSSPEMYFSSSEDGGRSALERISQYFVVSTAVLDSPLIGFGLVQNFSVNFDFLNNLDNYWLRVLLESGFLGLLLFLSLILFVVRKTFNKLRERDIGKQEKLYYVSILSFLVIFMFYKLFLSMPVNNVYFFMVCAMLFCHIDCIARYKISVIAQSQHANSFNT